MRKLTVLVAVMLVVTLLTGCWLFPESKLDEITVEPAGVIPLAIGNIQQLEVTAWYEDGTSADVTPSCDYLPSLSEPEVITVDDGGLITAVETGSATILVTYTQHNMWTGRIIRTAGVDVTVN